MMCVRLVCAATFGVLLIGCSSQKTPGLPAAGAALATTVLQPVQTPVERQFNGLIEAVNQGTVAAQTSGRVEAIYYDVNDFVPAGAVILRLRSTEQHAGLAGAKAALSEARAREAEAETRFQRIADMYRRKVVPKAALDEATANRDVAMGRSNAALAALESAKEGVAYTAVRAPYAGVVTKRQVQVGEVVGPGTPLMSGLSLQFLRVAVDVPQSIVDQVRRLKQAAVYIDERRIEASKVTIFPEATSPSSTFRARLELPEKAADLYPGMFVKVGFIVGSAERLLVPNQAIVRRSEVTAVYTVGADGHAAMRQVRLGDRFGDQTEVLAALKAGDRIALNPLAAAKMVEPTAPACTP